MKLTLAGLKDTAAWQAAGIKLPSYDVEKLAENTRKAPVWVHFGAGNIFRIFIGGLADKLIEEGALDKGITCVETFDFDVNCKRRDTRWLCHNSPAAKRPSAFHPEIAQSPHCPS